MRRLLNLLLMLSLLLSASCLPADQLTSEGSGADLMLSDAADPDVPVPGSEDLSPDLNALDSEIIDEEIAEKDELFNSLADLLKQMQTLETKNTAELKPEPELEPSLEPDLEPQPEPESGLHSEQELEGETAPEQEPKPKPESELRVENELGIQTEESEHEEDQPDPSLEKEPEQKSEQESDGMVSVTHEGESTGQESETHETKQGSLGAERQDSEPTVLPVQLLNVPVVPEPVVPEPERMAPEPALPEPATTEPAEPESAEHEPSEPAGSEEALVARDTLPADEPLEQNEVPLPAPARQPVHEPLIIAETATCLGCVTPILQDGADLRRMANKAAQLLEEELNSRYTFRVTEVYRASKQVVNGIKYFFTLEVAPTSCERPLPPFTLCFVASDAPSLIYSVELLHQPHRANTELLNVRKVDRSEIAQFSGLFAAASEELATEAPHRKPAPIAPGDSLLDILMGLDSVINKQRDRQPAEETDSSDPLPPRAERPHHPPLQMSAADPPLLQPERPRPPPLQAEPQAEPALQADWQAEVQQRHSASQQALRVQAQLRESGWTGTAGGRRRAEPVTEAELGEEAEEEESRCREGRQYDVQQVPLNVAHPRVQEILHKFLETQERSGSNRLVITDLRSATQQTISETNYRFEFVLGVSECLKNSTAHRYSCSATNASPLSDCRVRARHRPGKPLQFNTVSCTSARQPQCANGLCQPTEIHPYAPLYVQPPKVTIEVDIHDPTYHQLVQHVQDEVNRRSRKPFLKKFIKTLNATKVSYNLEETSEIIDQELYSLTLRFAETVCGRTGEPASQEQCLREWQPTDPSPTSLCDVRVSSIGWADRMRVLDLFCETEASSEAA